MKEQCIKEGPREGTLPQPSLTSLETGGAIWANFAADDLLTASLLTRQRQVSNVVHQFICGSMGDAGLRYVVAKVKAHASTLGRL